MLKIQVKSKDKHLDPPRYPKLILPIEKEMEKEFDVVMKKMMIDVTKQLTVAMKRKG